MKKNTRGGFTAVKEKGHLRTQDEKFFLVALPCRNFCILGADYISVDPLSGKETVCCCHYAGGATGALIQSIPETKTCETTRCRTMPARLAVPYLKEKEMLLIKYMCRSRSVASA